MVWSLPKKENSFSSWIQYSCYMTTIQGTCHMSFHLSLGQTLLLKASLCFHWEPNGISFSNGLWFLLLNMFPPLSVNAFIMQSCWCPGVSSGVHKLPKLSCGPWNGWPTFYCIIHCVPSWFTGFYQKNFCKFLLTLSQEPPPCHLNTWVEHWVTGNRQFTTLHR